MSFSRTWNELTPVGAVTPANTIDLLFRQLKVDIRERIESLGATGWDTDDPLGFASLVLSGANPKILGAVTSLRFRNLADDFTILELFDTKDAVFGRDLTVTRNFLTTGVSNFTGLLSANGGLAVTGASVFNDNITLANDAQRADLYFDNGITPGVAQTIDWNKGNNQKFTHGANNITVTFSNPLPGAVYIISRKQDAVGGRTVAWPGNCVQSGTWYSAGLAANVTSVQMFYYDGTNYVLLAQQQWI